VLKMWSRGQAVPPWNHATTALPPHDANVLWSRGLKHCHILELRDKPELTLTRRSLRNLALMNYFVFPNGVKHFRTERNGWSDEKNTVDLGESRTVCDYAFHDSTNL
jgi:hypothetical protein